MTQWLIGAAMALLMPALLYNAARRRSRTTDNARDPANLSAAERAAALQRVRDWMNA